MPATPQYNSNPTTMRPHVINKAGKGQEKVLRKMDERSGNMLLFELSDSSLDLDDLEFGGEIIPKRNSSQSDAIPRRCVSFSDELVRDIWERPTTDPEEQQDLYYTAEEIWGFRMDYKASMRSRALKNREEIREEINREEINEPDNMSFLSKKFKGIWRNATEVASSLVQAEIPPTQRQEEKRQQEENQIITDRYM